MRSEAFRRHANALLTVSQIFHNSDCKQGLVLEIAGSIVDGDEKQIIKPAQIDTLIIDGCIITDWARSLLPWVIPLTLRLLNMNSGQVGVLASSMMDGLLELDLGGSDVCARDFKLRRFDAVNSLVLLDARLSGNSDDFLRSFPNLASLNLSSQDVSLPTINCLQAMPKLRTLILAGRGEGIDRFTEISNALPQCEVEG